MESTKETRKYHVAEIQLTYKANVKPSLRPKISTSKDARILPILRNFMQ
jgi:hypothetical protein